MPHDAPTSPTIVVVDDDSSIRRSLQYLLESVHYRVQTFVCAADALGWPELSAASCIITDLRMPGLSGLEFHQTLLERQVEVPTIVITGHGDVPAVVRALKAGVFDFIQKPFNDQALLDTVARAVSDWATARAKTLAFTDLEARRESLSPREREVFEQVVLGLANKNIATRFDISEKTVEAHRANIMRKMQAESFAALVRMAVALEKSERRAA